MPGQELLLQPAGLYTDPSAFGSASPGALRTADDVVIRRKGSVQPRPGFQGGEFTGATLNEIYGYVDFVGATGTPAHLTVGEPDTTNTTFWSTGNAVTKAETGALPWTRGHIFGAVARRFLYLSTSDYVRRLISTSDTTADRAGAPPPFLVLRTGSASGTAVLTVTTVSYRAVVVRKTSTGLVVRSAPSNRVIFKNTSVGTVDAVMTALVHEADDNAATTTIELYRSLAVDNPDLPPDEHFFVREIQLSSYSASITDTTPESQLGGKLYTNEDQEGLENSNYRPPQAKDVHEFNGSLFLANLTYPAQYRVQFKVTSGLTAATSAGIGQRSLSGTYTNGSATVTGVADTSGFRIGQIIDNGLAEWADVTNFVRVTSIVNNTSVTFSSTYTGSTGSKARAVYDSIRINSNYFPVGTSYYPETLARFWNDVDFATPLLGTGAYSPDVYALTEDTRLATYDGSSAAYTDPTFRTVTFRAIAPTASPFTIYATHGSEYSPALPEPTASGQAADQDVFPSGVAWSKNLEPEHFSLVDVELIGSDQADSWRIMKGRDSLWVLKRDGIWRCTGAGRDAGFRFDPISGARILHPTAAATMHGDVFVWTDQGVLNLDSGENVVQSMPVRNLLQPAQVSCGDLASHGIWMASNPKDREILISIPDVDDLGASDYVLVYNLNTQSWTRWFSDAGWVVNCAFAPKSGSPPPSGQQGMLRLGLDGTYTAANLVELVEHVQPNAFDLSYSTTLTSVTGQQVVVAASAWDPQVGDALVGGGDLDFFIVTAVASATSVTVHKTGFVTGGEGIVAYVGFTSVIEPLAMTAKNPSLLKNWSDGSNLWGSIVGLYQYTQSFTSSVSQTAVSYTNTLTDLVASVLGTAHAGIARSMRFLVPRNHARTDQLFPKLTIRQAGAQWRWDGISLFYSQMSQRLRGR